MTNACRGKKGRGIWHFWVCCAVAILSSAVCYGQATGSFSGNVVDKSGSGVPGATVTVTSQETGLTREGKTDEAGHYIVPLLPVGLFTIRVNGSGFQSLAGG